jgi:hypothetical protein
MAANDNAPPVNARRTIAELEAELEKCTAERDEALARENAVAQVMQVINSSPGDLTPVFGGAAARVGRSFGLLCCPALTERGGKKGALGPLS